MGDDAKKKRVQKRLPLDFFSTRNFVSEKEKPKKKNFQKILKTNMYPPKKNEPAAPEKQGFNNLLYIHWGVYKMGQNQSAQAKNLRKNS